jgi:hypothetical protein
MRYTLYPPLIAALPALAILANNIGEVNILSVWRLLILEILIASLLTRLIGRLINDTHRAALGFSILLITWGFYGWLTWATIPVTILGVVILIRCFDAHRLTPWINLITIAVCSFLVIITCWTGIPRDLSGHANESGSALKAPDVYFILLDSYAGNSTLRSIGIDNSAFLDQLSGLGFQVGDCQSPATRTVASLTAYLNPTNSPSGWEAIYNNELRTGLQKRGYSTFAFASGFVWTELTNADRFITPAYGLLPTELEGLVLDQTPLSLLNINSAHTRNERFRLRALNLLAHLPDAASDPGAQFVFAHVIQPHPPFVFAADGSSTLDDTYPNYVPDQYLVGYANQVAYISAALLPALEKVIETAPDSRIILTGDHCPWYPNDEQVHSVLCATYGLRSQDAGAAVEEILGGY